MPVQQGYTTRNGERKGYFQWGNSGKKYLYTPGNKASRERAKSMAKKQGAAAHASGYGD